MIKEFFISMVSDIEIKATPLALLRAVYFVGTLTLVCSAIKSWSKRKIFLNPFLHGMWEGQLYDAKDSEFVIHCKLYIIKYYDTCNGHLIYESRINGSVYAYGVDNLLHEDGESLVATNWNPKFERYFHCKPNSNQVIDNKSIFQYNCKIKNRFTKNKMLVKMEFRGREMEGIWRRNS